MRKLTTQEMGRMTQEEFHDALKLPLVVVLDNVRSMHNVGAVFRTADAFRIGKIWLCGCTATPPNQEIHKTALGAENTVEWEYTEDTKQAIESLRKEGYKIFSVEQTTDSINLSDLLSSKMSVEAMGGKIAIVMGHEVFGVQQEVVDMSDGCIEIPQYGTKHSLNVSVAAGIVMYVLGESLRDLNNN